MRICDVADAYHAESGGIRTYLDRKIRFLRSQAGFEHTLIVPAEKDTFVQDGPARVFGIASPLVPGCAPYRMLLRSERIARILAEIDPDVVEIANPYGKPREARRLRGRIGGAVVGFYHTDFPRAYVETPLRRLAGRRIARFAGKGAARYARHVHAKLDRTVVSSPALARKLRAAGVPRVELVPLGVDTEVFHPSRRDPAWRRSHGVGDGELLLVYAGRLDAEKRADVLVEMMDRLPESLTARLLLLGQGPGRKRLETRAARDPRILVLPFEGDRERLARILASADLYVSAARFETFGLSVLEAQACGLPVVGQRAGAMTDRVPPGAGILVSRLDPGDMAEAVARAAANGIEGMRREARRVAERQSWDRTFHRLLDVYRGAAESWPGRPCVDRRARGLARAGSATSTDASFASSGLTWDPRPDVRHSVSFRVSPAWGLSDGAHASRSETEP